MSATTYPVRVDARLDTPLSRWLWAIKWLLAKSVVTTITAGDWDVVVMNPDSSAGLTVRTDIGVTSPSLPWIAGGMLAAGTVLAVSGVRLIVIPIRRTSP